MERTVRGRAQETGRETQVARCCAGPVGEERYGWSTEQRGEVGKHAVAPDERACAGDDCSHGTPVGGVHYGDPVVPAELGSDPVACAEHHDRPALREGTQRAAQVGKAALQAQVELHELVTERPDLEQVFLSLTHGMAGIR